MNITPRSFCKCLGVVSLLNLVSGLFQLQVAEDSVQTALKKKKNSKNIPLVNVTEEKKKQYKVFRYSLIQGLNECQEDLIFLIISWFFYSLFCLHFQAALLCVVAESPHIHPHSSKPSGKESPLPVAEVPGFTSIGLIRSISLHCGQGNLMCSLAKSESAVYFLELMGELL